MTRRDTFASLVMPYVMEHYSKDHHGVVIFEDCAREAFTIADVMMHVADNYNTKKGTYND